MVPGITDTDCRVAEFRYRDLRANAERQRIAAQAHLVPPDRDGFSAIIPGQLSALVLRMSSRLRSAHTAETTGAKTTPALSVGQ